MTNSAGKVGLSAFALKMIMVAFMVMDHLAYFLPHIFPFWFRYVGRIVAPTFCYLMTVSLRHTHDRGRYITRLVTAGLVMFAGSLALMYTLLGQPIVHNIFLSLALSAVLVDRVERAAQQKDNLAANTFIIAALVVLCFYIEGSFLLPVMALVFYFMRGNKPAMLLVYLLAGTGVVLIAGMRSYQLLQVFAVIPIALYSGEKGRDSAGAKWFFYIFYPLHIWALYVIRHLFFS